MKKYSNPRTIPVSLLVTRGRFILRSSSSRVHTGMAWKRSNAILQGFHRAAKLFSQNIKSRSVRLASATVAGVG
eukprot:1394326-Amorphochlora_amoeboformis.AAC.1